MARPCHHDYPVPLTEPATLAFWGSSCTPASALPCSSPILVFLGGFSISCDFLNCSCYPPPSPFALPLER